MDFDKIKDYVDVYKISSMVNKVKNAVYNYTEYEIKVRDATNNEPWGASSTLMQEIAAGTNHYTHFTEIMETIYGRFHEKGGSQWRQIYKALQLLEYLIKNGSERVIDSARDHIYELKALRNFHYVDDKGKDQGINVRNRAKEIAELLGDNDKIKAERKRARENRQKYTGVGSSGFGSRYGGYGPDSTSYEGSSSYDGASTYRDEEESRATESFRDTQTTRSETRDTRSKTSAPPSKVATTASAVNLLDIGTTDDGWADFSGPTTQTPAGTAVKPAPNDDFADFQSAPTNTTLSANHSFPSVPAPTPAPAPNQMGFASFANFSPAPTKPASAVADLLGGFPPSSNPTPGSAFTTLSSQSTGSSVGAFNIAKPTPPKSNDPFSKLVSLDANALAGGGKREEQTGPSLNSLAPTNGTAFGQFGQFSTASPTKPVMGGMMMSSNQRPMASGASSGGFAAFAAQPSPNQQSGQNGPQQSLF